MRDVCEVDELDALVRLVTQGPGVALVPETATQAAGLRQCVWSTSASYTAERAMSEPAASLAGIVTMAYGVSVGAQ